MKKTRARNSKLEFEKNSFLPISHANMMRKWAVEQKLESSQRDKLISLVSLLIKKDVRVFFCHVTHTCAFIRDEEELDIPIPSYLTVNGRSDGLVERDREQRKEVLQRFKVAEKNESLTLSCRLIFSLFGKRMKDLSDGLDRENSVLLEDPHPHLITTVIKEEKRINAINGKNVFLTTLMAAARLEQKAVEEGTLSSMALSILNCNMAKKVIFSYLGEFAPLGFTKPLPVDPPQNKCVIS